MFVRHPDHGAQATGWVQVPSLGGRRPVERGTFRLFVDDADPEAEGRVWGAGVLHIRRVDLLKQLSTMRATGPDLKAQTSAMVRFGRLFLGKLWDSYGSRILPFGPA